MITHNEITALLWLAVAASSGWAGLAIGHWYWPLRSRLDDEYDRGYRKGAHDGYSGGWADGWYDAVHSENVPRPANAEGRIGEPPGLATMPGGTGPGHTYAEGVMPIDPGRHEARSVQPQPLVSARPAAPPPAAGRTYDDITPLAMSLDALEPDGLPPPPADLSAWWASELDGVVSNGQSDWYTAMAGL